MLGGNIQVHLTAIIDDGATVGDGSRVWHFAHICAEAVIGKNVSIGQGVFVGNRVAIGDNCKIQNNVSVYDNVTLEDGVFCGPSMVFTNVFNPRALVQKKRRIPRHSDKAWLSLGARITIVCGIEVGSLRLSALVRLLIVMLRLIH